ncbi:hypothetical protein [Mycolicibacterium sp. lyk4-40-TYG-92]|uniref:hypothetical protein n=1 Tax=Mycolicibacterium sp. lyk4-40-TYG-92 TaxID=3040295 RepID=UPI002550C6A3|nr:hypothetical protein [Mycolicibacterium sp. lyk4-40-TYG-92]
MWRQGLERKVDDIGHHDDVAQRNIDDHEPSELGRADRRYFGTCHRIARATDARDRDRWADDARPSGDPVATRHSVPTADPITTADPDAVTSALGWT